MTEAKVDVYLPLFVGDYLTDTTDLTAEEHGVYLLLLMDLWKREGRLPTDPVRLARIARLDFARWETVWATVSRFFEVEDGYLIQGRLTREMDRAKARKAAASENGRRGGLAKGKQTASELPSEVSSKPSSKHVADSTSSSPSSSPSSSSSPPPSPSPPEEKIPLRGPPAAGAALVLVSAEPEESGADQIRAVIAHYRTHHPRALTPTSKSKEWRLIRERIREGATVEDLKTAIDGYHVNPFHCGENPGGQKHQALELIVRDGSHVTSGIGYAEQHAKDEPVMSEKERRGVRASVSWLSRSRANGDPSAR